MIYIIILIWNGKKYLPNLFKSLADLNYPKERFKLLVVDSKSTDGSLEYLENLEKQDKIKLIKLASNLGFAAGNNIGMDYALKNGAEYIILLNQDTVVDVKFLTELVQVAESDKKIGIVQSLLLYYKNKNIINSWGNEQHFLGYGYCGGNLKKIQDSRFKIQDSKEIIYASGAAVLYKAVMLKKIGLFDENYFSYNEDADICLRAKLQGYKTVLAPKSIVYHDHAFPTHKNKQRYFWMERNRIYLIFKFYKFWTLFLILPIMLVMDLGQFIFAIKRGYIWQWLKSRFWFKFNSYKLLKARWTIQRTRQIGDKELTQNFASEIKYQPVQNFLLDKIGNPMMKMYWGIVKKLI